MADELIKNAGNGVLGPISAVLPSGVNKTSISRPRDSTADILKGFAILLMVYGHVTHIGSAEQYQVSITKFIYTFHMPLFLLLSGFFFSIPASFATALKRLFRRLVVPYLVFITVYLIGLAAVQGSGIRTNNAGPSSIQDFFQIVFFHPRGAYWFIHSLIILQLSFILPKAVLKEETTFGTYIVAASTLSILSSLQLIEVRTITYFLLGMLLREVNGTLPRLWAVGCALAVVLSLTLWNFLFSFSMVEICWNFSLLLILVSLAQRLIKTRRAAGAAALSFLGRNSLAILVFHALFIVGAKSLAKPFLAADPTGILYSGVVTAFGISGSLVAGYVCDRLRISGALFGVDKVVSPFATRLAP